MDEQEKADRMAAAEALFMISTRGNKNKSESATRRSRRGRKKKEIIDDVAKVDYIHTDTSEDEVKLKKAKRGQPNNDNVTKSSGDWRTTKFRTIGKKFSKDISDGINIDQSFQSKVSRTTPKKRHKTKNDPFSNDSPITTQAPDEHEIRVVEGYKSSKTHKKLGKGKLSKVANETLRTEGIKSDKEIKALGFTGVPVTLSSVAKHPKPSSPRSRTPSTYSDSSQQQLKSIDIMSSPTSMNLFSMNASTPEAVSLPSLPTGIGSLQLPSHPLPSLSSLTETKRPDSSVNDREEFQKQLPLKKRKLLGAAQVEEEKMVEDISDAEDEASCAGQVQATFTVQAPPIITMQTLMEIKTALTPDEDGDLPLHIAVVHENMRMVTKLINLMRIAVKGVDKFNKQQQTPFHLAVKLNFVPAVDLLITSGANINTVDWTGSSAIHMAVQGGFYECLELILKRCSNAEINARNFEGLSPLHLAVTNKDIKQVQLLLKFKADIDLPDGKSGRTALFHAAETNQKNLVELLLKQGANSDLTNYAGVTATMAAQGRNLHSILKLMGSVVQDKQDSKWSTVTVKSQSGSVMMQVNQDNEVIDGSTFVVEPPTGMSSGGSTSSLLQRLYPVSSTLLSQGTSNAASDNKAAMYENAAVISEAASVRIESFPLYSQKASSSSSPSTPRPPPEIKIETKGLSSLGHLDLSHGSNHCFISSRTSRSSIPIIRVKQEVNDNSSEDTSVTLPSSTLSSSSSKSVIVSKSSGLPVSVGAIGLSGKPIMRQLSAKMATSNDNKDKVGGSSTSDKINAATILHNEQIASLTQSPQEEMVRLSLPSGTPRRLSSSPISSPLSSLRSTSPTSPSRIASPSATATTTITSNSDTFTLTSKQARLYKRLLEMYNINPGASSPLSSLPSTTSPLLSLPSTTSPPVLISLPLYNHPSPASDNNHSPPTSSTPTPSSTPSSGTHLKSSDHNTPDFHLKSHQSSHFNQPFSLQRSLSTQDSSTSNSLRYPHTNTKPLSPPHKISILRVSDPAAILPFKSNFNNFLPREEIQHSHTLTNLLNDHPKSQRFHRVLNHNDNSHTSPATNETHLDVPLNLSAKNYSSISVGYSDTNDGKTGNDHANNDNKHPLQKNSSSTSGMPEDKNIKTNREELVKGSLTTLPEFPHIAKSVSPKTASYIRSFLSQQKQHLQAYTYQQQHQKEGLSPKQDSPPSSSSDKVVTSSSLLPSKQAFSHQEGKSSHSGTLKSINIPPLTTSKSSSLLSRAVSLPSTQSSSLPASPSSVVSTLSLPVFNVKTYLSVTKDATVPGLVTVSPSITASMSTPSAVTAVANNPSFLHQMGRVIDLSVGEEHRGAVNKFTNSPRSNTPQNIKISNVESKDKNTDAVSNMKGKMVGFSGAIISIPSSRSSQRAERSNSISKMSENAKTDKTAVLSSTMMTTIATTTTNMKEKAKRKGRKAGGAKSTHAVPSLTDSPMPMQNKINSETDQRLKKFLGMKRSEQSSSGGGGSVGGGDGGSISSTLNSDKVRKERSVPGDATSSKSESESSSGNTNNDGVNNNDNNSNNNDYNNVSPSLFGQSASDHPNNSEPTIETVGIFSGNIQHVKIKSSTLKSLPTTVSSSSSFTSSTKGNNSGGKKSISPNAANVMTSNVTLPKSLTLSSWRLSSKRTSSLSTDHETHLDNDTDLSNRIVADGRNVGTSSVSLEDGDNDVYYSERIVWRSSPLLSIPSSPPSSEKQEVAKKSQKLKKDEAGIANVLTSNAAVVVKPAQEEIAEISLINASSQKDLTNFDESNVCRNSVDNVGEGECVAVERGSSSVYGLKNIVTLDNKKGSKMKLHGRETLSVFKLGDRIAGHEHNTKKVTNFEKHLEDDTTSQRKESTGVGEGESDSLVLRRKESSLSHKDSDDENSNGDESLVKDSKDVKGKRTSTAVVGSQLGKVGAKVDDGKHQLMNVSLAVGDGGGDVRNRTQSLEIQGQKNLDASEKSDFHGDNSTNCSGEIVNSIGSSSSSVNDSGDERERGGGGSGGSKYKKGGDIDAVLYSGAADVIEKASSTTTAVVNRGGGGNGAELNRMSVEEEQELVIDLGISPTDGNNTFVMTKTK